MCPTRGDYASSIWLVKKWFAEFYYGLTQLRSLHLNNWENRQYGIGKSETERTWDRRHHRHIRWLTGFDFEQWLEFDKAIYKMHAAFNYHWPQIQLQLRRSGVVQPQFGFFASFHNCGQNMDLLQYTRT